MRRYTIQEPAVVRNNDRTAGKIFQRFFQRPKRIDIQIVRRFIEQKDVRSLFKDFGKMNAIALAAGEKADRLLLIGAGKVKSPHISAGIDLPAAEFDQFLSAGNFLPDGFFRIERTHLIHIAELNSIADRDRPGIGRFLSDNHFK